MAQYHFLMVPHFGYWGFGDLSGVLECLYLLPLMVAPALCMPERIDRPSALFAFLNYTIIYVPVCVLLFHSTLTSISLADQWAILIALAASTALLFEVPRLPSIPLRRGRLSGGAILAACWCVLGAVVLMTLAVNRIGFFGFKGIGAARAAYTENIRPLGPYFGYFDAWCGLAIIPFLFVVCLRKDRRWGWLLLSAVCVLLFMTSGRKTALLTPLAVLGSYFGVKKGLRTPALLFVFSGLLLVPFVFGALGLSGPRDLYYNVINFRIFAVPQILIPQYYSYYLANGFTHFRSINVVNRFFFGGAAFEQPWAAIARFYYKKKFTADAVFYATDGLAALGIVGIPCVTAACVLVFWIFDSLQKGHSALLMLPCMMPFLFSLFNNSLFTTMLTGGGFVLMALFYLLPDTA
jgi:hypothetical protein